MSALLRIVQVAITELAGALRSRRAIAVLVLYLAAAMFSMNGTISIFGRIEQELVTMLQLPTGDETGVVSKTLWQSKVFQKMVRRSVDNDLVYDDISGRHPVELVYAWFAFLCAPLLVVLVGANRVSDDLHSGSVRYMVVRTTRAEWSLGKLAGEAVLIAVALALSAVGAWGVAVWRLSGVSAGELLPAMFAWGAKAWLYSFAWLGLVLGLSHLTRSGARATVLGVVAIVVFSVMPLLLTWGVRVEAYPGWVQNLEILFPSAAKNALWRQSATPLLAGAFHLFMLGFCYYSLGMAHFQRRDV